MKEPSAIQFLLLTILFATNSLASDKEIALKNDTNVQLTPSWINSNILMQDAKTCNYVTTLKQTVHATEKSMLSVQEYLTIAKMKMAELENLSCNRTKNVITKLPKPKTDFETSSNTQLPRSCADIKKKLSLSKSGIYPIQPQYSNDSLNVYCDMDTTTGGWTVIQKRTDTDGEHENFFRSWDDYKNGFGDLNGEFWLGNDAIFALTNQDNTALRIDMEDFDGAKKYALYTSFKVASEDNGYKVQVKGFQGDAGDSFSKHNDKIFHTYDRDRTDKNCVQNHKGGWWYHGTCHDANLNGLYLGESLASPADSIIWAAFRGHKYSLRKVQMKVRPEHYDKIKTLLSMIPKI